eukprot:CAMPEP_0184012708 /NCGR_PEP_ID=MMETSP0954-20121128/4589_1 /TAXON_ID=627963 /ORGANISM="Aplanochytrium sp, Strain PBS07" /LENGTH=247 /DNA_ID=CAMNT_0026292779 /DNA_START=40 /DNA_END=780 /DNA_ORIENTATION=-
MALPVALHEATASEAIFAVAFLHVVVYFLKGRVPAVVATALDGLLIACRVLVFFQVCDALLHAIILPSSYFNGNIDSNVETRKWEPINIRNENVTLSAARFSPPNVDDKNNWLVFFPPNGMFFEQLLPYIEKFAKSLKVNVLSFNYRGVGKSTGWPKRSSDLIADGNAVVQYVEKNFSPNRMMLHGWSIGGGVAGEVSCDGCVFVSDRSFGRLSDVGTFMMSNPASGALWGSALVSSFFWAVAGMNN